MSGVDARVHLYICRRCKLLNSATKCERCGREVLPPAELKEIKGTELSEATKALIELARKARHAM